MGLMDLPGHRHGEAEEAKWQFINQATWTRDAAGTHRRELAGGDFIEISQVKDAFFPRISQRGNLDHCDTALRSPGQPKRFTSLAEAKEYAWLCLVASVTGRVLLETVAIPPSPPVKSD